MSHSHEGLEVHLTASNASEIRDILTVVGEPTTLPFVTALTQETDWTLYLLVTMLLHLEPLAWVSALLVSRELVLQPC